MKYIKIYENFDKKYYYFDAIQFYNDFLLVFDFEKKNPDSDFFKILEDIWHKNLLYDDSKRNKISTAQELVKWILKNKEVEFYNFYNGGNIVKGMVIKTEFWKPFANEFSYIITFKDNYGINVDYEMPFKIYGEPTEIEKYVELNALPIKYNIV